MCRLLVIVLLSFILAHVSGCGPDKQPLTNQQSLDDLALLIGSNAELAAASLQDIKISSDPQLSKTVSDQSFALDENPSAQSKIDTKVAKRAQNLIDKILDQFDFEADLNAGFKILGIFLNEQKEKIKYLENHSKAHAHSKFLESDPKMSKDISCEAFLDNPFMKIPKEKYNEITRINREQIKETLSGCPDLEAQRFLQCMVDFNMIISLVNQHANCDLKNFRELETILDKNMGGKFHEKNKALKDCMTIDFSRCGFKFEKIAQDK